MNFIFFCSVEISFRGLDNGGCGLGSSGDEVQGDNNNHHDHDEDGCDEGDDEDDDGDDDDGGGGGDDDHGTVNVIYLCHATCDMWPKSGDKQT